MESIMLQSGVRLSVSAVGILTVAYHGAACNATSTHFGLTIRRTDIRVLYLPLLSFVFNRPSVLEDVQVELIANWR